MRPDVRKNADMHACSPAARLAPSHDGAFLRGAKPSLARGSHAKQQDRMHGHPAACALFVDAACQERRRACAEASVQGVQAGKYTASSGGIQSWRLARGMPMQTAYACAMTVAFLTPQTKTLETEESTHAAERACLDTKNKSMTRTKRYEGIITTKETRALHNDVGYCCQRAVHGARALGLVALRRLLQWSKQNVASKRPLPRCPSFKRPVRALLFPLTCLRRMHLRLTL